MASDPLFCHQRLEAAKRKLQRAKDLQMGGASAASAASPMEPQTALYVHMVSSPHLLQFLVGIYLVIAEVFLSGP